MRLFVAFPLSAGVRSVLRRWQDRLSATCEGVRWIPDEQLHVTVKFLGDVADERVPEVAAGMNEGASACSPCTLSLSACGCFPPRGPVRIVWAGPSESGDVGASCSQEIVRCAGLIAAAVEHVGFPAERRGWTPHVTIGRVRDDRSNGGIRRATERFAAPLAEQRIDDVVLMSSVLSGRGPCYSVVATATLGGAAERP